MRILARVSVGKRILLIGCVSLLGLVLVLALSIGGLNTALRKSFNERTKQSVDIAYSQIVRFEGEEKAGRMTRGQAQAAAMETIKSLRFGDDNYFFLLDMNHKMLMHPVKPELVGQSVYDKTDGAGKFHYREMVSQVAAKGEGFIAYQYKMPDGSSIRPKISYAKGFKPWGWLLVTGVFDSEIRAAVNEAVVTLGTVVAVILAMLASVILVISGSITRPIKKITARMRSLAGGDTQAEIPGTDRGDEIGGMAAALQVFRENAVAKQATEAAKAQADADQKAVVELLSAKLRALSQGDLTSMIADGVPESYVMLSDDFNTALGNLRELIGALAEAAHSIETGSKEIAGASEDLARRTETNAASLEQTSAALSQMNGRLQSSAQAAERTVDSAQQAIGIVDLGRSTAELATSAMMRVADSADGIDDVIAGLDKIAFQTRVLAMNAAVEAGRAGEAGRGFAVVADLVSALAMRAEEEAGRARQQLTATQADVVVAVDAVRNVDAALAQITGSVAQVHQFVETMASDNRSQVSTIGEIASAVNAMDLSTQQNAAMVEETSAAARNLANEVGTLTQQSSRFDVGGKASASRGQIFGAAVPAARAESSPTPPGTARQLEVAGSHDWASF